MYMPQAFLLSSECNFLYVVTDSSPAFVNFMDLGLGESVYGHHLSPP